MSLSSTIFYLIAVFILTTAVMAVTTRKIFRSAVYLLFCMMGVAGFYFWLNYEFVAAVQIVVYVGGIVVLIIFSIFLTQHVGLEMEKPKLSKIIFTLLAAVFSFGFFYWIMEAHEFPEAFNNPPAELSVKTIGQQMLSTTQHGYILPFEVISILLLAAMIGCIVIAIKPEATKP